MSRSDEPQISFTLNEYRMPKSTSKKTTHKPVYRRILKEVSNTPPSTSVRAKKTDEFSPTKLSFNHTVQIPTVQKKFNVFNDAGLNDESMLNQNVNANVNSTVLTYPQFYDHSSSQSVPIPVKTSSKYVHQNQSVVKPMPIMSEKGVSASSSSSSETAKQTLFELPFSGPSSSSSVPIFLFPQNNSTSDVMIAKDNDEVSPFNVIRLLIFSN